MWPVLLALATWRLAALLCFEGGPFSVLTRLRRLLVHARLGRLVACFHCTAFWIALIATAAVYGLRGATIVLALAVAGGASVIESALHPAPHTSEDSTDE